MRMQWQEFSNYPTHEEYFPFSILANYRVLPYTRADIVAMN